VAKKKSPIEVLGHGAQHVPSDAENADFLVVAPHRDSAVIVVVKAVDDLLGLVFG